ncbi:MAG: endonuclease III [Alphaproteobacteria bacterium CG_4_10_14_0_8_um_filter_37_21]|nr:MAG: endonuclease III [Alphaproteobacteria bacterium CG_4_10_14_0_8_um_filter_37_21]
MTINKNIGKIFKIWQEANPEPKSDLLYTNTYTLLVAVALSAQSTDKGVNKATEKLFKEIKTPKDMLRLGEERLKNHIKTIGLYNTKAKNVIKAAQILVDNFNGQIPDNRKDLESLPGVGRKTANVVLNIAFGKATLAVDTHIFRVANRIGFTQAKNPLQTEQQLHPIIPQEYIHQAHHWLILHGRYICKARNPLCLECNVAKFCPSRGAF